ncbi:MAG: TlyA family RNA methyltransferase [Spirochaetota bacterium]|nr:MAG: TlyA family RNA methyltransferase [Spirochaetota bacterium]
MKKRLDTLLVERGIASSKQKANAFITCGNIIVNGEKVRKPATRVNDDSIIDYHQTNEGYVSRGGIKLEGALKDFQIDVSGAYCLDIGASTGGFTDCLLQSGAREVIALDVGKNQIDYRLRSDSRVSVVEGFNARFIDQFKPCRQIDIVTIDVSFISLRLIVTPLLKIVSDDTIIIALIKPQFELEKPYKGFKGVVHDPALHIEILKGLNEFFFLNGYNVAGYTKSKIRGPKGNIEYFALMRVKSEDSEDNSKILNKEIEQLVHHRSV